MQARLIPLASLILAVWICYLAIRVLLSLAVWIAYSVVIPQMGTYTPSTYLTRVVGDSEATSEPTPTLEPVALPSTRQAAIQTAVSLGLKWNRKDPTARILRRIEVALA